MTHQTHLFRASKVPSAKHLHCLWNHLTDKKFNGLNPSFKIVQDNRLIRVTSNIPLMLKHVDLQDLSFDFVRSEEASPLLLSVGDYVHVVGTFSYSVHRTHNVDRCPLDPLGQYRPDLKEHFLSYLTKCTGLDFHETSSNAFSLSTIGDKAHDKIYLNDIIEVDTTVRVIDQNTAQELAYNAIARRKSYGFGHLSVDVIKP
jgi:hypothetical protein